MKRILLTLAAVIIAAAVSAQDNWFFPAQGKTNRYKTTASTIAGSQTLYSAMRITEADAGRITVATEVFASADADTPAQTSYIKYEVTDDAYVVNFRDALASTLGTMKDVEVTESSREMIYPKNPENGKNYGTAAIKFAADMMGMNIEVNAEVKERAVTAAETVKVPAGEFDCLKFEETTVVNFTGQKIETKTTSWIARGVGVVKQTTDSMNGMVTVSLELSSVEDQK